MYKIDTHFHFIGIGGIGMSALATILAQQGYRVSGCDRDMEQKSIKNLRALGCTIINGNGSPECFDPSIDILVYSSAIRSNNPEIKAAIDRGIPVISRAQLLAELMKQKFSIAVAGSHGKTTTSSLLAHVLLDAEIDPTIIVGGHLQELGTNARLGTGRFLVAEADESDRSFTLLYPAIAVVTNIDLEHLDTYKDIDDIIDVFVQFVSRLPWYGKVIACIDNEHVRTMLQQLPPSFCHRVITYGLHEDADIRALAHHLGATSSTASIEVFGKKIDGVTINLPGIHNLVNALAVIAVGNEIGIPLETIATSLATFSGVEQRFTYRGLFNGAEVFDDYGHHPTEIAHVIPVAKKRAQQRLVMVFQPHRYTRTEKLWDDFVKLFADALTKKEIDTLIITDIFPASEDPIPGITSEKFVEAIKALAPGNHVIYLPLDESAAALTQYLTDHVKADDLLLFQGAGKINKISEKLAR